MKDTVVIDLTNDIYDDARFLARLLPKTRGGNQVDPIDLLRRYSPGSKLFVSYLSHMPDGALLVQVRDQGFVLSAKGCVTIEDYRNG